MTEAAGSPDGRQLAFVMGTYSALRVAIANADGSGVRLVGPDLVAPEVIDDGAIDIAGAPDGLSLVIFDEVAPEATAWSLDVISGEATELTSPFATWQRLAP